MTLGTVSDLKAERLKLAAQGKLTSTLKTGALKPGAVKTGASADESWMTAAVGYGMSEGITFTEVDAAPLRPKVVAFRRTGLPADPSR